MIQKASIIFSDRFWCVYAQSGGSGWFADPNAYHCIWEGEPEPDELALAVRQAHNASRALTGKEIMELFEDSSHLGWEEMLQKIAARFGYKNETDVQTQTKEIWTRASEGENYLQATASKGEAVRGLHRKIELSSFEDDDLADRIFEISEACK